MTAEELLAAMRADGAEKPIKLESTRWGTLYVRPPNVAEFDRLRKHVRSMREQQGDQDDGEEGDLNRALLAAHVICDETGKRVLDPENKDHIAILEARRGADLKQLIDVAFGDATGN